jgi:hypothetical protein
MAPRASFQVVFQPAKAAARLFFRLGLSLRDSRMRPAHAAPRASAASAKSSAPSRFSRGGRGAALAEIQKGFRIEGALGFAVFNCLL